TVQLSTAPGGQTAASLASELSADRARSSGWRSRIAGAIGVGAIAIAAIVGFLWMRAEKTTAIEPATADASPVPAAAPPAIEPAGGTEIAAAPLVPSAPPVQPPGAVSVAPSAQAAPVAKPLLPRPSVS